MFIDADSRAISDTHTEIVETHEHGCVMRFCRSAVDKENIQSWTTSLNCALRDFNVRMSVLVHFLLSQAIAAANDS